MYACYLFRFAIVQISPRWQTCFYSSQGHHDSLNGVWSFPLLQTATGIYHIRIVHAPFLRRAFWTLLRWQMIHNTCNWMVKNTWTFVFAMAYFLHTKLWPLCFARCRAMAYLWNILSSLPHDSQKKFFLVDLLCTGTPSWNLRICNLRFLFVV